MMLVLTRNTNINCSMKHTEHVCNKTYRAGNQNTGIKGTYRNKQTNHKKKPTYMEYRIPTRPDSWFDYLRNWLAFPQLQKLIWCVFFDQCWFLEKSPVFYSLMRHVPYLHQYHWTTPDLLKWPGTPRINSRIMYELKNHNTKNAYWLHRPHQITFNLLFFRNCENKGPS